MSDWLLNYEGFSPRDERLREALCTLGNGYFATRGAAPEATSDDIHHPGTYIAGVYNRLVSEVAGRPVENESLVNAPNWLPLRFRAEGGPWFGDDETRVLDHEVELSIQRGVLTRRSRLIDADGRIVAVTQRRFVSMRDPHLAGLETTLSLENWSGRLEVSSALDGTVRNNGVARYAGLDDVHLVPVRAERKDDEVISLVLETNQSRIRIAQAARTRLRLNGEPITASPVTLQRPGFIGLQYALDVTAGDELTVEKIVAVFTSRDQGISEPGEEAEDWASNVAGDFEELLARHVVSWRHVWGRIRVEIGTDHHIARLLHLHLFHMVQTVSNNSAVNDVGVPARGLHGEAYRGHIFWDELFITPFLSLRSPTLTRALLMYRYRRLDHARRAATRVYGDGGAAGAMFPWQSASNGRETTQTLHLNPKSGRWMPDASHLQRHVDAAIAYNSWQYFQATGDVEFLRFFGAELMLEIARFWATIATYDHIEDRYCIRGVMGPDEYHERYPDREDPGLDNNAYTNVMAVWCLCRAFDVLDALPPVSAQELRERLVITEQELDRWDEISRKMKVCFHDGVISQFEGFDQLEEFDRTDYMERYGDIQRLDRILEAEDDTTNRYKISKQPDVTMLFYLLSREELAELFERLGYDFDDDLVARNVRYYEERTVDGSSLSRVVHAWINARLDRKRSWDLFVQALLSDVDDVQGGTTGEGIHLGAMAGTVDLLQRCYTGLEIRQEVLRLNPSIPEELGSLAFDIRYRGHVVHLAFAPDVAKVRVDLAEGEPITVDIAGVVKLVEPGETLEVKLQRN
jgi:trehalose/maltose hydrolase-like predicted phosphorylase